MRDGISHLLRDAFSDGAMLARNISALHRARLARNVSCAALRDVTSRDVAPHHLARNVTSRGGQEEKYIKGKGAARGSRGNRGVGNALAGGILAHPSRLAQHRAGRRTFLLPGIPIPRTPRVVPRHICLMHAQSLRDLLRACAMPARSSCARAIHARCKSCRRTM